MKTKTTKSKRDGYAIARVVGQPRVQTFVRSDETMSYCRKHKIKMSRTYKRTVHDSYVVEVPVVMTTVPEVPEAIYIGKNIFVKSNDYPLTYTWISIWKARRRK